MEIKVNDYVVIKKDASDLKAYAATAQKEGYPLVVYQIMSPTTVGVYTKDISKNGFQQNPFIMEIKLLEKISDKDRDKLYKSFNKDFLKVQLERLKKIKTKRIPLKDRKDYETKDKQILSVMSNYFSIIPCGQIKNNNYTLGTLRGGNHLGGVCCASSKTKSDIVFYIQESVLKYFGYNATDLNNWVKFLSGCGIGYEGKVLRKVPLKDIYPNVASAKNLTLNANNTYRDVDEPWYEVFVNGDSTYHMYTYLRFIVTRFMHSSIYWNIPFIAMKLKKMIPSLTNWECLIAACANENYDPYYGLMQNSDHNLVLPSKYNSAENVMSRLKGNSGINTCFKAYNGVMNLRKAIKAEDFEVVEEIIKKYRDVN